MYISHLLLLFFFKLIIYLLYRFHGWAAARANVGFEKLLLSICLMANGDTQA